MRWLRDSAGAAWPGSRGFALNFERSPGVRRLPQATSGALVAGIRPTGSTHGSTLTRSFVISAGVRAVALATVIMIAVGCTPRLSPLYRDFSIEKPVPNDQDLRGQIGEALDEAGWTVIDGVTSNIVATESRKFHTWVVYRMEVELEVAPVGKGYVRVFIHPYRRYFTGSRGKMPYLKKGFANSIMETLEEPFASRGLKFAGTADSRDQAYRENGG